MLSVNYERNLGTNTTPSRRLFRRAYVVAYDAYEHNSWATTIHSGVYISPAVEILHSIFRDRVSQNVVRYENILWRRSNAAYKRSRCFSEQVD